MCRSKNNEKGITLIALIITIIVMLILVGVTINVAINGGLVERAKTATKEMERVQIEELVIAGYVFEDLASERTILSYLDIPATGREIFKNLTANGFKLKDEEGNEFVTAEAFVSAHGGEIIELHIQGKHEQYEGSVTKKGLGKEGIKIKTQKPGGNKPVLPNESTVAYKLEVLNLTFLETSKEDMIIYTGEVGIKYKIVPCTNIFDLKTAATSNEIKNNTGIDIEYSKAIIDQNGDFGGAVYIEKLDKWNWFVRNTNNTTGEVHYSIENTNFCEKINLSQEEINKILQSVIEIN